MVLAVDWLQSRTEVPLSGEMGLEFNVKANEKHDDIDGSRINGKMNVKNYNQTASPSKTL